MGRGKSAKFGVFIILLTSLLIGLFAGWVAFVELDNILISFAFFVFTFLFFGAFLGVVFKKTTKIVYKSGSYFIPKKITEANNIVFKKQKKWRKLVKDQHDNIGSIKPNPIKPSIYKNPIKQIMSSKDGDEIKKILDDYKNKKGGNQDDNNSAFV